MKITLKYEESSEADLQMTLRLTLPQKYINGPTSAVVKLFVDHYNKKHQEDQLSAESLHLKIVGGDHLSRDARVSETLANGDEAYLLGEAARTSPVAKRAAVAKEPAPAPAQVPATSSKPTDGLVRCKRFGCQQKFDPNGPPQPCVYHKSPPIFHETAKWWSCCSDKKAYEFEEFMRIPGCQTGFCSAVADDQAGQKRFLGGSDLRGDTAPQRLDADAPPDPRQKLAVLLKGLVAIGVDGALMEEVWRKLAEQNNDLEKAVEVFRARFVGVLNQLE